MCNGYYMKNGHGDPCSDSGQSCLLSHSTNTLVKGMNWAILSSVMVNSRVDWRFNLVMATDLGEGRLWI